jgi:hypothetical protein
MPLEGEFKRLRDAGWLPINLAADPHYPTHLMIAARDQHASELLHQALGDAFDIPQLQIPMMRMTRPIRERRKMTEKS